MLQHAIRIGQRLSRVKAPIIYSQVRCTSAAPRQVVLPIAGPSRIESHEEYECIISGGAGDYSGQVGERWVMR